MSRLTPYSEYKDSGVKWLGDVPVGWSVAPIKYVATLRTSNVDKKSIEGEKPVLLCNYTDVYYNDSIRADMDFMPATASESQIEAFTLQAGDTIITKDSETSDDIGLAAHVPDSLEGVVCGYHLAVYRPVDVRYGSFIKRFFDSKYAKSLLDVSAQGVTRVGLGQSALKNLIMPVPPVEEAVEIAAYLDRETIETDAFIADQEELISLLNERRTATIARAVTKGLNPHVDMKSSGIGSIADFPKHWVREKLSRLGLSHESGTSVNGYSDTEDLWAARVLKTGCASKGYFDPSENKKVVEDDLGRVTCPVRPGSLIVNRANTPDLVGSAAMVEGDHPNLYLSDKLWQINFSRSENRFMYWWMKTGAYKSQIRFHIVGASASMQNLSLTDFKGFAIALPPMTEQVEIADYLDFETAEIDAAIADAKEAIELSKERRAALISAAVTGKIDVRDHKMAELGAA